MENPINVNNKSIVSLILYLSFAIIILSIYSFNLWFKMIIANPHSILLWGFFVVIIFYVIFTLIKIKPVISLMTRWEAYEYKIHEEKVVNELIDQDFKLLKMKIMQDEHNMKIFEFNKKHKGDKFQLEGVNWRSIQEISKQANTFDYYKRIYGHDILNSKENNNTKKDKK